MSSSPRRSFCWSVLIRHLVLDGSGKAMISIAALVGACVYVQVQITDWFRYIDITLPSRVSFGFTAIIACFEGWAAWRIVDATEPKTTGQILS